MLLGANASQEAAKANQLASSQVDIRHKYLRFGGRNYFLLPSTFFASGGKLSSWVALAGFGGNLVDAWCLSHCPTFIPSSISSTGLPRFISRHSVLMGEYSHKQITTCISVVGEANS